MNMLAENLKLVHLEGRETNFFRKLNAHDLLIIDDFGMVRLEGQLQHDFEQIIDDRYNRKATILASLLPTSDWYNVFQSELIAELVWTESCISIEILSFWREVKRKY